MIDYTQNPLQLPWWIFHGRFGRIKNGLFGWGAWLALIFLLLTVGHAFSETQASAETSARGIPNPAWEGDYRARLKSLLYSGTWTMNVRASSPEEAAPAWEALLVEMWKVQQDSIPLAALIANQGEAFVAGEYTGALRYPQSVPGLTRYYFQYRNRLPSDQREKILATLRTAQGFPDSDTSIWKVMKEQYRKGNPAGLLGFPWAEELNDTTLMREFGNCLDDWIRQLYQVGSHIWNAPEAWEHHFQCLLILHDVARDAKVRRQAQAALDWMAADAALHYIDGISFFPRSDPSRPFQGTPWTFAFLYFADADNKPSFSFRQASQHVRAGPIGFAAYSSYRPPLAILALARGKFELPQEISSVKPSKFKTDLRAAYETIYREENYLLWTLIPAIPDNQSSNPNLRQRAGQGLWGLAATGQANGPLLLSGGAEVEGGAENFEVPEEIGQYRNVMMRLVRSSAKLWMDMPSGLSLDIVENKVFADLGNGVFLAILAHNGGDPFTEPSPEGEGRIRWGWEFDEELASRKNGTMPAALVLEAGSAKVHGSFGQFKRNIKALVGFSSLSDGTLEYKSATGRTLGMPKIWKDGQLVDFGSWGVFGAAAGLDSEETAIRQKRGGGMLAISASGRTLHIKVDPRTADPVYIEPEPVPIPDSPDN